MKRWLPVFAYAAMIFFFSSLPGSKLSHSWAAHHDKIVHTLEYAAFAFLIARACQPHWWIAILVGLLFGVSDEFHQTFTPGRSGNDLGDLFADLTGSVGGSLAWVLWHHYLRPRRIAATKGG